MSFVAGFAQVPAELSGDRIQRGEDVVRIAGGFRIRSHRRPTGGINQLSCDAIFQHLEKAYDEKSPDLLPNLKADVRIDNFRSDSRFQNLARRVQLPQ